MRILLLADLHSRPDWLHWVATCGAKSADLTAIAGDLLDGFHLAGLLPQMMALRKWTETFPGQLVVSSGNHDANIEGAAVSGELWEICDRGAAREILIREYWMDALERPGVVTDRRCQLLETAGKKVVVTTIPFYPGQDGPRICTQLWDAGRRLRTTAGARWLVLNHEPPAGTKVGGAYGDAALFYRIEEYQPDYVVSGHMHAQPYSGDFADRIGRTWCFNPGAPEANRTHLAKVPNHILLDTATGTAAWRATPASGQTPIARVRSLG
jgi:predicted phosphodiesterase